MRILFLTPFLPDPVARHGGGRYLGSLCQALAERAEVGVVHLDHPDEPANGTVRWHWRRSAAYQGAPPARGRLAHRARLLLRWSRSPLLAAKYWQPELPALLREARRDFAPDVVLVEMAQMAQYLPLLADLPSVFTEHEAGIPANSGTGLGAFADRRDAALWRRHLARVCAPASLVQALTAQDAAVLGGLLGREVLVRPPALDLPDTVCRPEAAPRRALFLGDYHHAPNREAARRLSRQVLPLLRKIVPNAELLLAGPHSELIADLADLPGVQLRGYVEDLTALLAEARLVLAPLWSGAGFRVKAATALAHGLPVVGNALGARGLQAPPTALRIVEDDESLATASADLLSSPDAARQAGAEARTWAEHHLAAGPVAELQLQRLAALLRDRATPAADWRR